MCSRRLSITPETPSLTSWPEGREAAREEGESERREGESYAAIQRNTARGGQVKESEEEIENRKSRTRNIKGNE